MQMDLFRFLVTNAHINGLYCPFSSCMWKLCVCVMTIKAITIIIMWKIYLNLKPTMSLTNWMSNGGGFFKCRIQCLVYKHPYILKCIIYILLVNDMNGNLLPLADWAHHEFWGETIDLRKRLLDRFLLLFFPIFLKKFDRADKATMMKYYSNVHI